MNKINQSQDKFPTVVKILSSENFHSFYLFSDIELLNNLLFLQHVEFIEE
jgi:hypothetical protein